MREVREARGGGGGGVEMMDEGDGGDGGKLVCGDLVLYELGFDEWGF